MFDFTDDKKRFLFSGFMSFIIFAVILTIVGSITAPKDAKNHHIASKNDKEFSSNSQETMSSEENFKNKDFNKKIDQKIKYIVKKGDSLYKIAIENNMSIKELKKINSLKSNNLSIGQTLLLN